MSNIKQLSPHLKILEVFGLQYFSLFSLNLKSKKFNFTFTKYILYFFAVSISYIIITTVLHSSYFLEPYYHENFLGSLFRIFTVFSSIFSAFVAFFEAFLKIKGNKKFFKIFEEFLNFIKIEFRLNLQNYFIKFKKVLIRRIFLAIFYTIFIYVYDFYVFGLFDELDKFGFFCYFCY